MDLDAAVPDFLGNFMRKDGDKGADCIRNVPGNKLAADRKPIQNVVQEICHQVEDARSFHRWVLSIKAVLGLKVVELGIFLLLSV